MVCILVFGLAVLSPTRFRSVREFYPCGCCTATALETEVEVPEIMPQNLVKMVPRQTLPPRYFDLDTAKFMEPIGLEHFFDAFALNQKRTLKVDAAAALNIPLDDVSDSLVVKQDRANRFDLTPVWAPAEPLAKRAKTAEVRLSSASDVPMTPRSDDNAKGSSDEEDSDSSGSNSDVSSQDDSLDVSDLEKFEDAIPTSAPSLLEWSHELWNGIALVTQMRRFLVLTH